MITPPDSSPVSTADKPSDNMLDNLIPMPVSVETTGNTFTLSPDSRIYVQPDNPEIAAVGQYLADKLNASTGYQLQVLPSTNAIQKGNIILTTEGGDSTLGEEGYELTVTSDQVTLVASQPAGLFRGIQTIRQLLPPTIESPTVQPGPWTMPTGVVKDYPRFVWRGAMLDVARHFFKVEDVKRFIDLMAYYKLNRFHFHLTDDQGWRIVINSWPNLASYGGSTQVGGGAGGYYTQAEYADIVAYAQSRYIMLVPEIDMPGHTNAALASYAELNCDGNAPPLYTETKVGFSSLCPGEEITYEFVDDVVREIAALTPGAYIHIGGDESAATKSDEYVEFIGLVQTIVSRHGKQMIGWEEIAEANLPPASIVQYWKNGEMAQKAVQQGAKVIVSLASKAYLDMKYDSTTPLGANWAGYIDLQTGYTWEPTTQISGISESNILGVEAALWSETIESSDGIEFMTFPRLLGYAEIGWSPLEGRNWDEYKGRLATHGQRLGELGVNYFQSSEISWE